MTDEERAKHERLIAFKAQQRQTRTAFHRELEAAQEAYKRELALQTEYLKKVGE